MEVLVPHRPDPLPARSTLLWRWFAAYGRRYLKRHFHAVRVSRAGPPPDLGRSAPAIVYLNHPAWWDPMVCFLVADRLFRGRRHHAPIEAAALVRYRFFTRLGFFPVEPGTTRGAASFLRTAASVLRRPDAMLWITAQGAFADVRHRPLRLRPGLGHLVLRTGGVTVVPLAVEYPFWDERLPEALLRFGSPIRVELGRGGNRRDAEGWTTRFATALEAVQDQLAEEAMSRDAGRFEILLAGSVGVGGVYDAWRSLAARWRGRRFDPEHRAVGRSS